VKLRIRRSVVIAGVVLSLVVGLVSIRVAARLAEAAAPPPAPPVSIATLTAELDAERANAASLQQQLDELVGATAQLTSALGATGDQVSLDGLTAAQLRDRLKAAEAKLTKISKLLTQAQARLAALQGAASQGSSGGSSSGATSGGTSGGTSSGTSPTPTPAPAGVTLTLAVASGGVDASWAGCPSSGFNSYALVRSLDSEIHYPPEDRDTLVARITDKGQTSLLDTAAPSGKLWYRLYCLTGSGELRVAASSPTRTVTVP
jgi:hypothetical protein